MCVCVCLCVCMSVQVDLLERYFLQALPYLFTDAVKTTKGLYLVIFGSKCSSHL